MSQTEDVTTSGFGHWGESPKPNVAVSGVPGATIIVTKTLVPASPSRVVTRSRLFRLLDEAMQGKVTSVVAPAGFGKTVLISGWVEQLPEARVGWVSLDGSDDDPSRFWLYVMAALTSAGVTVPGNEEIIGEWAGSGSTEPVRRAVVNGIVRFGIPLVLVLDDYHHITDPRIHHDVAFLLDQQLPDFHLVLLSRFDPPLGVSRWLARGQATQIRSHQLSFDKPEMALFLREQHVELSKDLEDALYGRVGGWAAALRLVTLWIADQGRPEEAIADFASSDAAIADYLSTEVLEQLPADLRDFLLRTSILTRLTGPLCDAVMDSTGHDLTLRLLFERGLFVEAADPDWTWFRYHQLFADLLRQQLRRHHPDLTEELHRRASGWFADNGYAAEAVEHALAARDWPGVQSLMLRETLEIGARYQPSVIERWLGSIPADRLARTAYFQLMYAFVWASTGRIPAARTALANAEALMVGGGDQPELPELGALLHVIRVGIARLFCDLPAARASATAVESALGGRQSEVAGLFRAASDASLAGALLWSGDMPAAQELVGRVLLRTDLRLLRMRVNAMSVQALVLATGGRLREAAAVAAESLELGQTLGLSGLFQTNAAFLATGLVALLRHETATARQFLELAAEHSENNADHAPRTIAGILLSRIDSEQAGAGAGLSTLDRTREAWPGWQAPAALQAALQAEEAHLHLMAGDLHSARDVLGRLEALPQDPPPVALATQLTRARVLEAGGETGGAGAFEIAARLALSTGQIPIAIEALIGRAVVGPPDQAALAHLDHAVQLAQDEHILAPFLFRKAVRPLLLRMASSRGSLSRASFRQEILEVMGVPRSPAPEQRPAGRAVDALTDRESSVLRLLGSNLSNTEIAAALNISGNTMKSHIRHIYAKLGVVTRQEAVLRLQ